MKGVCGGPVDPDDSNHPLGLRFGHWVLSFRAQLTGGNSNSEICASLNTPTVITKSGDVERLVNSNLQVWLDGVRVSSSTVTEYSGDPVGVGCWAGTFSCGAGTFICGGFGPA